MRITDCKPLGRGRYEVYLNGEAAFVLYKGDLARYHLKTGEVISEELHREICEEILVKRAIERLFYLLQSRDYTRYQLEQKLRQGRYPEEVVRAAIVKVVSYGYIDDERYAERYVECYQGRKSLGKIRRELLQKGIRRDTVEEAVKEAGEVEEQEQIRRLLEKRHFNMVKAERKEKEKQYAFLMRKGYKSSDILSVFRELS